MRLIFDEKYRFFENQDNSFKEFINDKYNYIISFVRCK